MEELGFLWLEEPFREQELRQYQELCRALTIPVMATEMLMHDVNICAQWLLAGATDLVRANARSGTTALLKLAHFAELYGTNVEMNGPGGWAGTSTSSCSARSPTRELFEHFERFAPLARECGITQPARTSSTATCRPRCCPAGAPRSTGTTSAPGRWPSTSRSGARTPRRARGHVDSSSGLRYVDVVS